MIIVLLLTAFFLVCSADPAAADPISAAVVASLGGTAVLGTIGAAVVAGIVEIGIGLAVSALYRAAVGTPTQKAGLRTEVATSGDTTPQTVMTGYYATSGNLVAPYYSWENDLIGDGQLRVHIYDLGDRPITDLVGIYINGDYFDVARDFGGSKIVTMETPAHLAGYVVDAGMTLTVDCPHQEYLDNVYMRWYNGTQTAVDPFLNAVFKHHPERPWGTGMIGRGVPYVILHFRYAEGLIQGEPTVRFVVKGSKLYDPRQDGTNGGTGTQRYGNLNTHAYTENPLVTAYNLMRGIEMPDGSVYGLKVDNARLPTSYWVSAMNTCDLDAGGKPRFSHGYETRLANPELGGDEPLDVIDELLKASNADICDLGGTWIVRVGAGGLPVDFITDDDILISQTQQFDMFSGLGKTHTAVAATYPDPDNLWEAKEAPLRVDTEAETKIGERLVADLTLNAVYDKKQVQRIQRSLLKDAQRMRRHSITLPPEYDVLNPLDTITWTSEENGYQDKVFDIVQKAVNPITLEVMLAIREKNPADYDFDDTLVLPTEAPSTTKKKGVPFELKGIVVAAVTENDDAGTPRRNAISMAWTLPPPQVHAVRYQIRRKFNQKLILTGTVDADQSPINRSSGAFIPDANYEVRLRPVSRKRKTKWCDWITVRLTNVQIDDKDIKPGGIKKDKLASDLDYVTSIVPPGKVSGLSITSSMKAHTGAARLVLTWNLPTGSDIVHYQIEGREVGDTDWAGFQSANRRHWFDAIPGRSYEFRVSAVDRRGNIGAWSDTVTHLASVDTVPPASITGLSAVGTFESIWLKWNANTEKDLSHYEVYEHTAATPAPTSGTTATFRAAANEYLRNDLPEGALRYYWVRAVDTSGNKSGWSASINSTTKGLGNRPVPVQVTGLTLTTQLLSVDGRQVAEINASWASATHAVSYELSIVRDGAPEVIVPVSGLSTSLNGFKGSAYTVMVRGVNDVGGRGTWSASKTITGAQDSVPPPLPTGLTATASFGAIWLKWNEVSAEDLSHYDVYASDTTTNPTAGTAATFKAPAASFLYSGLGDNVTKHLWVRAVDTSGNKSSWTARVQATTTQVVTDITAADIAGLVEATSFAASIKPVEVLSALPGTPHVSGRQVFLTTDKRLYRNTGSGWTAAVDAEQIVGSLVAGQIAAGAIGTEQLAADAVVAKNMLIMDFENIFAGSDFEDDNRIKWTLNTGASISTSRFKEGSRAMYMPSGSSAESNIELPVKEGDQFFVSYWVNIASSFDGTDNNTKLRFRDQAGNFAWALSVGVASTRNTWHLKEGVYTVPAGVTKIRPHFVTDQTSGAIWVDLMELRRKNSGSLIVDGTIKGNHVDTPSLAAAMIDVNVAYIKDANISGTITAAKITTGTQLNSGVLVGTTGTTIGTVQSWANDPANRINSGPNTQITPGKISITGGKTLDHWRYGNTTTIDGGTLATGTVTTQALTVGGGGNFIEDSAFQSDQDYLSLGGTGTVRTQTTIYTWEAGSSWAGPSQRTMSLRQQGTATDGQASLYFYKRGFGLTTGWSAKSGEWYDVSAHVSSHRCYGVLQLVFRNSANSWLGAVSVNTVTGAQGPGGDPDNWPFYWAKGQAPSGTTHIQMVLTKYGTSSSTDSWMMIHKPMIALTHSGATAPTPYVPGGVTRVSRGMIETNAIIAGHIDVNDLVVNGLANINTAYVKTGNIIDLTADKITVPSSGGLNAGIKIGSTGVTLGTVQDRADNPASRINANPATLIDPGRITISGETKLSDWRHPSNYTTINGGDIYTSTITATQINVKTIDIKTATVKTLNVETLNVENRAITNYSANYYEGGSGSASVGWEQYCNVTITPISEKNMWIQATIAIRSSSSYILSIWYTRPTINNNEYKMVEWPVSKHADNTYCNVVSINYKDDFFSGVGSTIKYLLKIYKNGDGSNMNTTHRFMSVMEFRR